MAEMALSGEEGEGLGQNCPPSKCVKKPWFQGKHCGTLAHWIWPRLWVNISSICSLHSHMSCFFTDSW